MRVIPFRLTVHLAFWDTWITMTFGNYLSLGSAAKIIAGGYVLAMSQNNQIKSLEYGSLGLCIR